MADTTLEKMDVGSLITQRIPEVETALSSSNWFKDETMELDFGEYVGRPSENALMHTSLLTYFLANGWKIKEVKNRFADGEWESHAESSGTNGVTAHSKTEAESKAEGETISNTGDGHVEGNPVTRAESKTSSSGSSSSEGESSSTGSFANVSISGGAPYWCAYQTVVLTRRKMQSELVLNDMIASFTKAYNEGRSVNNARYDELVALYSLMLSRTEDEANALPLTTLTPDDFLELSAKLETTVSEAFSEIKSAELDDALNALKDALDAARTLYGDDYKKMVEDARAAIALIKGSVETDAKGAVQKARTAIGLIKSAVETDAKGAWDEAKTAIAELKTLSAEELKDIFNGVKTAVDSALAKFAQSLDNLPENWLESRKEEINRQFDAKIAKAQQTMIANGTYSGTVWPNVLSGMERDRQYALTDLVDSLVTIKVDTYGKVAQITAETGGKIISGAATLADMQKTLADIESKILDGGIEVAKLESAFADSEKALLNGAMDAAKLESAFADSEQALLNGAMKISDIENGISETALKLAEAKRLVFNEKVAAAEAKVKAEQAITTVRSELMASAERVTDALRKSIISVTELRNTVLKWMFDFMERREDDYPGLEQLATIADRLGYSDGAVGGSIAS
jgi:uncharacterized protein YjiS (DUF1127 family)